MGLKRVLVRENGVSLRLCLDYRHLNSHTIGHAYMLPLIESILDSLAGAKWYTSLDLQGGYLQAEIEERDKAKTISKVGNLGFY